MTTSADKSAELSTVRAAAVYIGALLGPSVLLLPGLAASLAGPASIVAWIGLLMLSGLLARVFTALGTRVPGRGGVAAYASAGLGAPAGRAVAACFLAGVVLGAPLVCLIGGAYVSQLVGGGLGGTVGVAAALLVAVVALTIGGARATAAVQLVLVGMLVGLIAVAVFGSAPHLDAGNWTPFAPHGWSAIGSAASVLMLSFVGWEAIAPLTARLADPVRQLPRVIGIAFAVTSVVFLALAAATIGVLGPRAGSAVPVADLLQVALGPAGRVVAAVVAVVLTLATTNAYLSGAAELVASLRDNRPQRDARTWSLQLAIATTGAVVLAAVGTGLLTTAQLVAVPTALFLTVYLGCTAAAARLFAAWTRRFAATACVAVAVVLAFSSWALVVVVVVAVAGAVSGARSQRENTVNRICSGREADLSGARIGRYRAARTHHRDHRPGRAVSVRAAAGQRV